MRLAVLGSPIAHSKSPALHRAAYEVLGLDWTYDAIEVAGPALADFVRSRDAEWRGLSLTMPLKRDVLPLLSTMDEFSALTGAANTVRFGPDGSRHGFNTDVVGVIDAFRRFGITRLGSVRILGGGATAASVITAAARLGATVVVVAVRAPERLGPIVALCEELELELTVETLGAFDPGLATDAVISTLPTGTTLSHELPDAGTAILFDVAYEPWPTPLAASWLAHGGQVISGLELLAAQALAQIRIFVNGRPDAELADEAAVVRAMRAAVGLAD
jgi:shikimate dehydrogenase